MNNEYISDSETFSEVVRQVNLCAGLAKSQVPQFEIYKIKSMAFQGAGFVPLLHMLSSAGGSKEFIFVTLDPDPQTFFFSKTGFYPAIIFNSDIQEPDYLTKMMDGPLGDVGSSLAILTDIYYVIPDDLSWFIVGRRYPAEESLIYAKSGMTSLDSLDTSGWIEALDWSVQQLPTIILS